MHRIRTITLDLDDTLWEIGPVIQRAESLLWQWLSAHYPRIGERWSARKLVELRESIVEDYPDRAHDFRFLRKRVLAQVAVDSGYTEDLVEPAFDIFDAARNSVELFPEVIPELTRLSQHFTLIAITNGNANLHAIGIARLFDGIVTSVDVGVPKPARPMFDEAMRMADSAPEETLHVGDHPESDIDGARQVGMRTAWMNRFDDVWPEHFESPDAVVRTVSDVRSLLEPALRRSQS
jgi:HAD superfamily hydrolase (TIGR01509 family)